MNSVGTLAFLGSDELQGGAVFDEQLLHDQFRRDGETSKLRVIAAAAAYEQGKSAYERIQSWCSQRSIETVDSGLWARADADHAQHIEELRHSRFIYVADGSPLHLRSVLKDSEAWSALVEAWRNGATIVGAGAGAAVLSDPMVDPRGGALTLGLGLVRNAVIVPRLHRWTREWMRRLFTLVPDGVTVIEIPECCALVRTSEGVWSTRGAEEVALERNGKAIDLSELEQHTCILAAQG